MKGDAQLIETLNSLLADELTAINQYMVHAEMCENWGYDRLHEHFRGRSVEEMKHAERLIGRILFLEGRPTVNVLRKMLIGAEVPKMFEGDHELEMGAIKSYNAAIAQAVTVKDNATREMLEDILKDEDRHIDHIEERQDQIKQMTLEHFLSEQIKKD